MGGALATAVAVSTGISSAPWGRANASTRQRSHPWNSRLIEREPDLQRRRWRNRRHVRLPLPAAS